MRKLITLMTSMLLMVICHAEAADFETAKDAVKNMGVGWNLGNTLDANVQKVIDITDANYWGQQGLESETCWGQPKATKELIKMMKEAGFGTIRVPVTWYNHLDKDGNVNAEWMARVKEVVDYVIGEDLYCIINVHHDTGADSYSNGVLTGAHWIHADEDNYKANKERFEFLWKQIAETFKDYNNKLLFESYNEMLDKLNSWCFASFSASGQYDATIATSAYNALNSYVKSFVNVVRASGGNNAQRNLIINTYAAANGSGTWNTHLKEPLTKLTVPTGEKNHIAVEVHAYPSIVNGSSDKTITYIKSETKELMDGLNTNFVSKGIPVIIGEWGTSNVDAKETDYDARRSLMLLFVEDFVKQAKALNIPTIYWMGLSDGSFRSIPAFNQADLAKCIAKAYHGSDFEGKYPTKDPNASTTIFEGEQMLAWGTAITVAASNFTNMEDNAVVEVSYKQKHVEDYGMFQFWYADWSSKIKIYVDGKEFDSDFNPGDYYNTEDGTEHVTQFTFDTSTFTNIKKKGILFQGNGIVVTKVELKKSGSSGINDAIINQNSDGAIYNLRGQRITSPSKGIYIQNGKKFIK